MFKNLSERSRAWAYAFFAQGVWGTGGVTIKLIDAALPASLLVVIRHGVGALVLGFALMRGKTHLLKNIPWAHVVMFGVIGAGFADLFLVEAIRHAGAIIPIILARLEIPISVVLAHLFLKEKVGKTAYFATLLSLAGAWLISYRSDVAMDFSDGFYVGVLFALGAAVMWGIATVYGKYILKKGADPLPLSCIRLSVGALFNLVIVLVLIQNPLPIFQKLSVLDWSLLIYLGVFLSGLAYLTFYRSLKVLDAHVASILLSVSLGVALFLGIAIGESPSIAQWLGIALVILSIVLIQTNQTKKN
jgi:drug/metabolite transporter (DMT)-like permease